MVGNYCIIIVKWHVVNEMICYRHKLRVRPHLSRNTIGFISSVNSFLFFPFIRQKSLQTHDDVWTSLHPTKDRLLRDFSDVVYIKHHSSHWLFWLRNIQPPVVHARTHTRARTDTPTHAHRRKWNNLSRIIFNGGFHSPRLFSEIRSKDCFRILSCKTCGNVLLANNQQPDHHTVGWTIERTMADNQPTVLSMQLFLFTNNFHSTRKLIFSAANVMWHLF
jgi:hypothetical protein